MRSDTNLLIITGKKPIQVATILGLCSPLHHFCVTWGTHLNLHWFPFIHLKILTGEIANVLELIISVIEERVLKYYNTLFYLNDKCPHHLFFPFREESKHLHSPINSNYVD